VAAGLAMSLQLMSLLVQRLVDTSGSADERKDDSTETRIAEISLRLCAGTHLTVGVPDACRDATLVIRKACAKCCYEQCKRSNTHTIQFDNTRYHLI